MLSAVFVLPGPLARTGGYIYDARIIDGLRQRGWTVEVIELRGAFPFPDAAALADAGRTFSSIADGRVVVVDGLALGAIPDVAEAHASRLRLVALVHLPLAADVSRDPAVAERLAASEGRALGAAALVVVTSRATLPMIAAYALPPDRVTVVGPGTDRVPHRHPRSSQDTDARPDTLELLCVGTINAGKGHDTLMEALATVTHQQQWHLTCAGSLTRDPDAVARIRAAIRTRRLQERVFLAGELDEDAMLAAYFRADVFVLPTRQETYGMAVAEAIAHGLPVIATRTGAIPWLVGDDAGRVVAPGDVDALAAALDELIGDAHLRARLAAGARARAAQLPTWDDACQEMSAALARVDRHG